MHHASGAGKDFFEGSLDGEATQGPALDRRSRNFEETRWEMEARQAGRKILLAIRGLLVLRITSGVSRKHHTLGRSLVCEHGPLNGADYHSYQSGHQR